MVAHTTNQVWTGGAGSRFQGRTTSEYSVAQPYIEALPEGFSLNRRDRLGECQVDFVLNEKVERDRNRRTQPGIHTAAFVDSECVKCRETHLVCDFVNKVGVLADIVDPAEISGKRGICIQVRIDLSTPAQWTRVPEIEG